MKFLITASGLSIMILSVSAYVNAATLVETEDSHEGVQKMWVEGTKMRIDTGNNREYMLADYAKKKLLIIDPAKKEMIDASDFVNDTSENTKGLNVRVKHIGSGPNIAGYLTQKYALIVNGRTCNQTLVSIKALKDSKLEPMLEAMAKIDFNPMASQLMNECDRADLIFAKRLKNLGLPLGTIEKDGQIRGKVRRIVQNAKPPAGGFNAPSGYRTISMQQKMQEAMGGAMPPGAAGQMDPEMQKAIQEMMRQQGR
jgi:hypothetical protein